jgi:hypothetical protein
MHDVEAKQTTNKYYRNYIYRFIICGCKSGKISCGTTWFCGAQFEHLPVRNVKSVHLKCGVGKQPRLSSTNFSVKI